MLLSDTDHKHGSCNCKNLINKIMEDVIPANIGIKQMQYANKDMV